MPPLASSVTECQRYPANRVFATEPKMFIGVAIVAAAAFTISACVGLGGSLILVPFLGMVFGPKPGIALAGMMLAANNVAKVVVYRKTLPTRAIAGVLWPSAVGAYLGAELMTAAPASWVGAAAVGVIMLSFVGERAGIEKCLRFSAPGLAFAAGLTSGFAGTSGPLKGLALRGLTTDRAHLAGAASAVSLVGDLTKTAVYLQASLIDESSWPIAATVFLLTPFTASLGRLLNMRMGERVYAMMFWLVMFGYTLRLVLA